MTTFKSNVLKSRRGFLISAGVVVGSLAAGKLAFGNKKEALKPGADALVDEKSSLAVARKLYQDGSKVPPGIRPAKSGVEGVKQLCNNCMFYSKVKGEKDAEVGKCQLFPQGLVKGKAWCNSWAKKA